MNIFNIFGKRPLPEVQSKPIMSPISVITDLRNQIEMLEKRQTLLDVKIAKCMETARLKINVDKKSAVIELNKKKLYEEELNKLSGIMLTLETQILSLESATMNKRTLDVLNKSNLCLKTTNKAQDVDSVTDLIDSIDDEMDATRNISDALSRPVGQFLDERDLADEMAQLLQKEVEIPGLALPEVANVPIIINESKVLSEEDELRQLASSMS
jgi:charged multivesicular body protein 4